MNLINKLRDTVCELTEDGSSKKQSWQRLFLFAALAIYFYVFMEWLFFATKPSFMDTMEIGQKLEVLLVTGLLISLVSLPGLLILFALSAIPGISKGWKLFWFTGGLLPAVFLTATTLLLVDNFTYTVFQFGIVSAEGAVRTLYAAGFLVGLGFWYRWVLRRFSAQPANPPKDRSLTAQSIFGISIILVSSVLAFPKLAALNDLTREESAGRLTRRPNIILIGSDGVNASNMSVYGYERDTTPNLRRLAETSLVAENAFTNSGNTSGSIISILTGKLPTKTRVIYPPDILMGSDAYQHLPGILRSAGYYTVEISVPHYIDAYALNLQNSFDVVNDKKMDQAGFHAFTQLPAFEESGYFLSVLAERLSDRILHIFWIREMPNPYKEVTSDKQTALTDQRRINQLKKYLRKQSDQPLFIHVHLMGTHGPKFNPRQQVFSTGIYQDENWMTEFYDDSIHDFDTYFAQVMDQLAELGELENTLIILYSDHSQGFTTDKRIPLIFRFPNTEYTGRIQNNSQNLDIAPTVLDYLGLPIPKWMEGQSLLDKEPDLNRIIFSTAVAYATQTEEGTWVIDAERMVPPFYQFGYLRATICQNWYVQNFRELKWNTGEVVGYSSPCSPDQRPDDAFMQEKILERLRSDGFDVSTLEVYYSTLSDQ